MKKKVLMVLLVVAMIIGLAAWFGQRKEADRVQIR